VHLPYLSRWCSRRIWRVEKIVFLEGRGESVRKGFHEIRVRTISSKSGRSTGTFLFGTITDTKRHLPQQLEFYSLATALFSNPSALQQCSRTLRLLKLFAASRAFLIFHSYAGRWKFQGITLYDGIVKVAAAVAGDGKFTWPDLKRLLSFVVLLCLRG
jgi:hypothetical protein